MNYKESLRRIFYPKSVAVVGASNQFGKWGNILITNILAGGFDGPIYPVNPGEKKIAGLDCYPSILDIPEPADLVIISTPASTVAGIFKQMAQKGCGGAVVISSGFSEVGDEGKKLEEEIVQIAKESGFVFVGPNTMGISNAHTSLYATGVHARPKAGGVALIAQSGNLGTQLLAWAESQGIGIGIFSGSGNEAYINCEHYLRFLAEDENTSTILFYLEGVKDGRGFMEAAKEVAGKKPVIMLKGGRTERGATAAKSHTGSMAGSEKIYRAMSKQTGIVWADTSSELLDLSAAFANLPLPRGNRVGIVTLGGGWGVVTTDACSEHGLEVPPLPQQIVERIDQHLPKFWSRNNPVDLVGTRNPEAPMVSLEELVKWDEVDAVITLGVLGRNMMVFNMIDSGRKVMPDMPAEFWDIAYEKLREYNEQYKAFIVELMNKYEKPIVGVRLMDDGEGVSFGNEDARFRGVVYPTPERAVRVIAKMANYYKFISNL